jgi:excisionase family DNA binding protein
MRFRCGAMKHRRSDMAERWLSVDKIALHLGVNPDTIYKWITRKSMPAHRIGRLWKFLASEVDQWVKCGLAAQEPTGDALPKAAKRRSTKKL